MVDQWLLQFELEVDAHFCAGNNDRALREFYRWHKNVAAVIASLDPEITMDFMKTGRPFSFDRSDSQKGTSRAWFLRKRGNPAKQILQRIKQRALLGDNDTASGVPGIEGM